METLDDETKMKDNEMLPVTDDLLTRQRQYDDSVTLTTVKRSRDIPKRSIISVATFSSFKKFSIDITEASELASKNQPHCNDCIEFNFVLGGKYDIEINGKALSHSKGDIFVINKNTPHRELNGDFDMIYLSLTDAFFAQWPRDILPFCANDRRLTKFVITNAATSDSSMNYIDLRCRKPKGKAAFSRVKKLLQNIDAIIIGKQTNRRCLAYALIAELMENILDEQAFIAKEENLGSNDEYELINGIEAYIRKHGRTADANQLGDMFHYNPDYLNRLLKKHTGRTIKQLRMKYCLQEAAEYLLTTDISISKIVQMLGYENKTHFYDLFYKEYGMTPLEYRNGNRSSAQPPNTT